MKTEVIRAIIERNQLEIAQHQGVKREIEDLIYAEVSASPIKLINGFRRAGKSYLLKSLIQRATQQGCFKLANVLYLNFEDLQLDEINTAQKLNDFYQAFIESRSKEEPKILAFDEIQNVDKWDKFIRTIYETNKRDAIFITGSNSELLSSELGTNLAGRFIQFSLQPFSFSEYINYHSSISNKSTKELLLNNQLERERLLDGYLRYGGLPETFSITNDLTRHNYVQGIVSKVILDDIVKRFGLRNITALEKIFQYLCLNVGTVISYTKITKRLNQLGIKVEDDTVIQYISHLEKSFAVYEVAKFDWTTRKVFQGTKKYYTIDTALPNLYNRLTADTSRLLENLVYLKLRSNSETKYIYYSNDGKFEIDFITESWSGTLSKYQVTTELNDENYDRELGAFITNDRHLAKCPNIILTRKGQSQELKYNKTKVKQINLIEWLLLSQLA